MLLFAAGQAEPVDWLGFSRLGSPDTTLRDTASAKAAAAAEKPSAAAAGKDIGRTSEFGDGLPGGRTSRMPKADKSFSRQGSLFDDKTEKNTLDWLEMAAADRSTDKKPTSTGGRKSLDATQDDDWLGTRTHPEKTDPASDYLGLGSEIELTHKPLGLFYLSPIVFLSLCLSLRSCFSLRFVDYTLRHIFKF